MWYVITTPDNNIIILCECFSSVFQTGDDVIDKIDFILYLHCIYGSIHGNAYGFKIKFDNVYVIYI